MPKITLDIPQTTLEQVLEPRIPLHNIPWDHYESLLTLVGNRPRLRLTYLAGTLEIMTISPEHEMLKTIIARLLYTYADARDIDLFSCGSATFKKAATDRGLEPDESFCIGQRKEFPDLAIEVVLTSGGIDKLAVYQGLGIPEVWFWQDNHFRLYCLDPTGTAYNAPSHSTLFPELDLNHLALYIQPDNEPQAIRQFRQSLQSS
ncbi:Uma2 family endonuclease [Prochlorothrix hollandica]|uniref:Uma2 family endonuclease n=1 Tax=Prochlorothrix hollandica TaxID=1223 RepID=UPI00333E5E34